MTFTVPFGREFRHKYFAIDPKFIPLNHGSLGCAPISVMEAADEERRKVRANQDLYYRYDMVSSLVPARNAVAKIVDADPKDLVFIQNSSSGANIVLRSIPFQKGDVIVSCSTTYGACAKTLKFMEERDGIINALVTLTYPISSDEIVKAYSDVIEESEKHLGPVKLVFFDAVSSMPACRLPWERLVASCKEKGIPSFVDAAHSVGLLENISLNTIKPDYYVTNLHKWFYTPAPCGLLYVAPENHRKVQSFPISHTYVANDGTILPDDVQSTLLQKKFEKPSSTDFCNYFVVDKAAAFRRDVCGGEAAIIKYIYQLANDAAELFAKDLDGEVLRGSGSDDDESVDMDIRTAMVNVYIPLTEKYGIPAEDLPNAIALIQENLIRNYNVFFPFLIFQGRAMIRLSGQVYLEMLDFEEGLQALKKSIKDYQTGTIKLESLQIK